MAKLKIKSAAQAAQMVNDGQWASIGHNRWCERRGNVLFFGLHRTRLIEWDMDASTVRVRHGGRATYTTRSAIADFLRLFMRAANAADSGREAMLDGDWRPVGRDFNAFIV